MALPSIPSYLLKTLQTLLAVTAAVTGLFWFTVDLWVERKLPYIEAAFSEALERPVSARKAAFRPLGGFIFDGVEIKQFAPEPYPIRISRARFIPEFHLFPSPKIRIHKAVLENPVLTIRAKPQDLFLAAARLKGLPVFRAKVGSLTLEMDLASFEVRDAQAALRSWPGTKPWRHDFEKVDFVVGRTWLKKNVVRLSGRLAGKSDASFLVECEMKNTSPETLDSNMRLDLRNFTTAYLHSYLDERLNAPGDSVTASMKLRIREGTKVEARGEIDPGTGRKAQYAVSGTWIGEEGLFHSILLKDKRVEFRGQGNLLLSKERGRYDFRLASNLVPIVEHREMLSPFVPEWGHARFFAVLSGDGKRFEPSFETAFYDCALRWADRDLRLSRLTGRVRVTPRSLEALDIWTFVNDIPVRMAGRLVTEGRPSFRAEIASYPGQIEGLKPKNPFNFSLKAAGILHASGWNGSVRAVHTDYSSGKGVPHVWTAAFRELTSGARWNGRSLLLVRKKSETAGALRLFLPSFEFGFKSTSRNIQADAKVPMRENGELRARLSVDLPQALWETQLGVSNLDAGWVRAGLGLQEPLSGRLSAHVSWKGGRKGVLSKAQFTVVDGRYGPNERSLQWAERTGIDALKDIRFRSLSGEFSSQGTRWRLDRFRLLGQDVRLSADMAGRNQYVLGTLSAAFRASTIRASSELRWLLNFVRAGEWVDFDFKIAGTAASPRVEWLSGEFKKKVETKFAPWMKKELTRQIEKRLAAAALTA